MAAVEPGARTGRTEDAVVLLRARRHPSAPAGVLIDVVEVRSLGVGDVLLARATSVGQVCEVVQRWVEGIVGEPPRGGGRGPH